MPISAAPLNSTSYKIPEAVYAKHDGVYKEVQRIYGKRGGEYREIYNKKTYQLYGMHLVPGTTEYDITYLEDAAGKSPAYMNFETGVFNYGGWENAFFMPRPCMLKYDGTVDYYLDPNDYTKRVDISIPEDYKPVNYLKRTGNNVSYINTDIYINSYATTKADMAIKFENWYSNNDNSVFIGAKGAGDGDSWSSNISGGRGNVIFFWNGRGLDEPTVSVKTVVLGTLYNMHLGADYFAINDSKASVTPTPVETSLPGYPIVIFGGNNNGTIEAYNKTDLTIYNVVIRDVVNGAETITHFLIPAERQSDNQLGLYDAITGVFYPATGTFIKGEYGIKSDCDNIHYGGNAMMEWPLIWYKFVPGETTGEGYFYVSSEKLDDDYHCWCNIDCNGNVTHHFYTAIYAGTKTNVNTIRSISGVALTDSNTGRSDAGAQTLVEYAMANNLDDNVQWCAEVIADRMLINMLLVLISKSLDTQATFGNGVCGSTTLSNRLTGELNTRGLFWGSNTDTDGVKIFGMENYWGMLWHYMLGYIAQAFPKQAPRHNYIKLTWDTSDGSTTTGYNATKEGYIDLGTLTTGYNTQYSRLTKLSFSEKGYFPAEVGYNASGNNCNDGYIQGNMANYPYAAAMGGCYGLGQNCGAFALNFTEKLTGGVANGAVSLSCKPISHISQEVPTEIL